MRTRVLLTLLAILAVLCACSSDPQQRTLSERKRGTSPDTATVQSTMTGSPVRTPPPALRPDVASPALAKYGTGTVTAVLDLASRLARSSVTDERLLGTASEHQSVDDYAAITRYLTPQGVGYLRDYIRDQTVNSKHRYAAAQLALASVKVAKGPANITRGTLFVKPFNPKNYRATIDPKVGLGNDDITIVVTGTCSVSYDVIRQGTPEIVTFTRSRFTYYVQPEASAADARVGVSGWQSDSAAKYAAR